MSALQKTLYYLILERNLSQLNRALHGKGRKVGLINILVELRKCCNHPFLIDSGAVDWDKDKAEIMATIVKNCGKLTLLHKLLVRLKETGHRVLIFSQVPHLSLPPPLSLPLPPLFLLLPLLSPSSLPSLPLRSLFP